ncbi:MAG: beta-eliminating lyase-related protein [Anaerolineae bacterium]
MAHLPLEFKTTDVDAPTAAVDADPVLASADEHRRAFLNRTLMLLGDEAVRLLGTRTVAVAGCGGVGGAAAITLARMGVGGFILADPGLFDPPDINRQWAATRDTLGRNKAEVYEEVLRSIDPGLRVRSYSEGLTDDNVETFLDGADVVIDCLDIAVSGELRARLYQAARARGIYALCAPALGFGAALAIGAPDGLPMEAVFGKMLGEATARSTLPPGLRQLVVPEHLDACERHLSSLRVPSIAISPALASALMSAEIYLLLSGPQAPGWRPPPCLPQLLVVDPIRMTYQVVDIRDLAGAPAAPPPPLPQPPPVPPPPPAAAGPAAGPPRADPDLAEAEREARRRGLAAAGYNTNLLPPDAVAIDLLSDSWRERTPLDGPREPAPIPVDGLEARLAELYGYPHNLPVFRGRFAEALLAEALIQPGRRVVCNALFPTTRHHLAARGAILQELGIAAAHASQDPHPFKGDLDLDALRAALAEGDVQAVVVELCANTLGGHPVSLANLRAAGRLTAAAGIPLLLDATRAWENAALIRDREPGQQERRLGDIVREICACSTACAASLSKDFISPVGGFIGSRSPETHVQLRDRAVLAYGQELSAAEAATLGRAMATHPEQPGGAEDRAGLARRLHGALREAAVPVFEPAGGHAVFVDAQAFLPDLPAAAHPTAALCNALYVAGGLRAGANPAAPSAEAAGAREVLRLALPLGRTEAEGAAFVAAVVAAFERVAAERGAIKGLSILSRPPGMVDSFACVYQPL